MPKIKKENSQLLESLDILTKSMKDLTSRVETLENKLKKVEFLPEKPQEIPQIPQEKKEAPQAMKYPIPLEYRDLVDTVLNKKFGISIEYMGGNFAFTIVVPEEYSSLTADEKKLLGADLRTKIITYAEGINGVRQWVEQVYKNFNPEIQAGIVSDRI